MRNCSVQAISPFAKVFKSFVQQTLKNRVLFGEGLLNNSTQRKMAFEDVVEEGGKTGSQHILLFPILMGECNTILLCIRTYNSVALTH